MSWNLTLMAVHLLAAAGFWCLYPAAPCWMQKWVVALLMVAMTAVAMIYAAALVTGWSWSGDHLLVLMIPLLIEHAAVLLYVFRLIHNAHWSCKSYSQPSPR